MEKNKEVVWIAGISSYLPPEIVTNDEIIEAKQLKIKSSWIEKYIGIKTRHWAAPGVAASDLATKAVEGLKLPNFQGPIFVSTISSDYLTPSTASVLKKKLNLKNTYPAIDLNAACAGQLFALEMAKDRLLNHPEEHEALVIATEMRSRYLNKQDRRTVFLFGDGASVFHLKKAPEGQAPGIVEWGLSLTLTTEEEPILIPGGGSLLPFSQSVLDNNEWTITMRDGERIFQHTTQSLVGLIQETLKEKEIGIDSFQFFVFHQGNGAIIREVCKNLGVDLEKTWINFDRFGNTSSASMGLALGEAHALGKLKKGDRILMMAMGAGYHIGMCSVIWGLETPLQE